MKQIKQYLLEDLQLRDAIVVSLFSFVVLFLSVRNQGVALASVTLLMSLAYSFKNLSMSLTFVIVAGPFLDDLTSGFLLMLTYMPFLVVALYKSFFKRQITKANVVYIICVIYVLFSYLIGYKTESITLFLQIVAMTMLFCTWKLFTNKDASILVFAFLCSAIVACFYIFMGGIENNILAGRLAFGDNIKKLSTICAIPLSFFFYSFIGRIHIFRNLNGIIAQLLQVALAIFLTAVLFMTLARGIFLAFAIGVVVLLFLSKTRAKVYFFFIIVAILIFAVMQYIGSLDMFRIERLLDSEQMGTGNGRTEIWGHYIKKISEMGVQYVIMGTGPGGISRISNIEFYAHSTILDYYFSYGLVGIISFLLIELAIFKKLFNNLNKIPFVIALTFLLAYATHGGAANIEFFLLQGILVSIVNKKEYENICTSKLVQK